MNRSLLIKTALLSSTVILAAGCGTAAANGSSSTPAVSQPAAAVATARSMTILTGKMDGKPGWPEFTPSVWTAPQGSTVTLTIVSHDDGTAPLTSSSPYIKVSGTTTGSELVDGQAVTTVNAQNVAHTFTVPGLGINLPIPVAPTGGTITVKATFKLPKSGTFNWQCEAPCGTGSTGWGGPMITPGYMEGSVNVTAQ
ncbi:MAG: cupredoxin domain-containing protein [Sulfobacillus sp.]